MEKDEEEEEEQQQEGGHEGSSSEMGSKVGARLRRGMRPGTARAAAAGVEGALAGMACWSIDAHYPPASPYSLASPQYLLHCDKSSITDIIMNMNMNAQPAR